MFLVPAFHYYSLYTSVVSTLITFLKFAPIVEPIRILAQSFDLMPYVDGRSVHYTVVLPLHVLQKQNGFG